MDSGSGGRRGGGKDGGREGGRRGFGGGIWLLDEGEPGVGLGVGRKGGVVSEWNVLGSMELNWGVGCWMDT